jgi:hypothetical protein
MMPGRDCMKELVFRGLGVCKAWKDQCKVEELVYISLTERCFLEIFIHEKT